MLLQENTIATQSLATILDPDRLEEFKKYGEWIAVNRRKFDDIWTQQSLDPLADPLFWDILTDQQKYVDFVNEKYRNNPPTVFPKPIEMAMQYPQSQLLRQVCHIRVAPFPRAGSLFWQVY